MNLIERQLSYFTARGSQTYVSDLIDLLVQYVIASLPLGKHTPKEIYEELVKQTEIKFEFEQVLDSLERLVARKDIYSTTNSGDYYLREYGIDHAHKKLVAEKVNEQVGFENQVMDEWLSNLKGKYPELNDDQLSQIKSDLETFSLRVYLQHATDCIMLYTGNNENIVNLLEYLAVNSLGDILPIRDPAIHKIRVLELPKFFYEASTERKIYIGKKLNQLFLMHMMRLAPQGIMPYPQAINSGTLFLDTNFVIRLVGLYGVELQDASSDLIRLSYELGYHVAVTPKTVEEYKRKVNDLVANSKSLPNLSAEIADAALSQSASRDFLTYYWKRSKATNDYVSLEPYLQIYQNVEALLEYYGVIIDHTSDTAIRNNKKAVLDEMTLMRSLVGNLDLANDAAIEHDAHHRLLILHLRQGYEMKAPLENPYWFLTYDTKLPVYDRRARAKSNNQYKIPFCVLPSQWIQLLHPFTSSIAKMAVVQADTLDSPLFRVFRNPPTELLQEVITRMSVNRDVPPKAIAKIITNDAFVRIFNDSDDAGKERLIQEKTEEVLLLKYQEDINRMTEEMYLQSSKNALEGETMSESLNARLNLNTLDLMKRIALTSDPKSVLDVAVTEFPYLIGYNECLIYLQSDLFADFGGLVNINEREFNEIDTSYATGNSLVLAATNQKSQFLSVGKTLAVEKEGITGRVYKTGLPLGISDVIEKEAFPFINTAGLAIMFPGFEISDLLHGTKSALIFPLSIEGKTIGTLEFYSSASNTLENLYSNFYLALDLNIIISERLSALARTLRMKKQIDNLLMSLTHEIDTPLTGILAESENLAQEIPSDSEFLEPVQRIGGLVSRLQMQTATIMAVISGKIPQRRFTDHSIFRPLKEACELFKPEAKQKGCDIIDPRARDGKFPKIEMSLFDLTIAFKNLIHNAVKYSYKPPSNLDIHRTIKIWGQQDEQHLGYYVVHIQNYGVGINREEIEKGLIFREYYRGEKASDRKRTGAGFGLAYVKLVIEHLHHGYINVTSTPVEGGAYLTTFAIGLPIKQPT